MVESKVLPLSDVCLPMAVLVSGQGWSLIQSDGILGYNTQAFIEKDGVVISYINSRGGGRIMALGLVAPSIRF
jgi:hypothetical protein